MFLIRLHGDFFHKCQSGGWGGSKKQLLDGSIYSNSNVAEWKLVVPNVCISNFMTIPSSVNFSPANVRFGCKGLMYLHDFSLSLGSLT